MIDKQDFIKQVAREVKCLPPIPATITELRAVIALPDTDFAHVVPILKKDPGLCADLLRFANSASYGLAHEVTTVTEAVRCFGMKNLVDYVTSAFCEQAIRNSFSELQSLDDYFVHSRHVSHVCKLLAKSSGASGHQQEVVSLAGLLHDIGRLVMVLVAHKNSLVLLGTNWDQMQHVIKDEKNTLGIDHCAVSKVICRKWQYPIGLVDGISRHHTPVLGNTMNELGSIIFLGHFIGFDQLTDDMICTMFPEWALKKLNLTVEKLLEVRAICLADSVK